RGPVLDGRAGPHRARDLRRPDRARGRRDAERAAQAGAGGARDAAVDHPSREHAGRHARGRGGAAGLALVLFAPRHRRSLAGHGDRPGAGSAGAPQPLDAALGGPRRQRRSPMSLDPRVTAALPVDAGQSLADLDLFALGRQATAARDQRLGRRGSFVRARQLLADGTWRGPRDAAESYVDESDLEAAGGLDGARRTGVHALVAGRLSPAAHAAADAGLRVIVRVPFKLGEIDAAPFAIWGALPSTGGEPYGLDTLRLFALCRLSLPRVPHLLSDVGAL